MIQLNLYIVPIFYIFVEICLTFPTAIGRIVYGIVYAEVVWAAGAFHDNRQKPGFSRQIGSKQRTARLVALILHFFLPFTAVFANETA